MISFLSIGLIIIGRLVNMSESAKNYTYEGEAIRHTSTMIVLIFVVVSFVGFVISAVALVNSFRKPQLYAGKGIAVTAFILNGIFSLFSIGGILLVLPALLNYLVRK